jgi:long-chain fatty acid transport protein
MKNPRTLLALSAAVACAISPGAAEATNGYFAHGYGMKSIGMAGASTAMAQDTFGGANNPASMVFAGGGFDLGLNWFSPHRGMSRSDSAGGLNASVDSDKRNFFVPEFGYNRMIRPDLSLGVTVYGNGGMNTTYAGGQLNCGMGPGTANVMCGSGTLGQDMMQLIIAPTLAFRVNERHAFGVSPLIGYQRFKAEGLQAFDNPMMSGSPGNVTNRGYDDAWGYGLRVGYMGRLTDAVTVGAAYSTKISMGNFDKYKGLFAGQGSFDVPENYSLGVAWKPAAGWTLAFDYQRINYGGIASIANPSSAQAPLGADNGPGFGWKDIDVFKLGVQWQYSRELALRAGYNHGGKPIGSSDVTFNIIAPGVVTDHFTLGFTYALPEASELTMGFMYAPKKSVTGASAFNAFQPSIPSFGGNETIRMYEYSLGIAWSKRF